jgi:HPt (histidine-containing phosphotransfer) domain-containing protein
MNDNDCLDDVTLGKLVELGGNEFALQMIGLFLSYVPQKLAAARAAAQAGDWLGVQKAVHPIKSSAGNIGARSLRELAARIEELAMGQRGETIPAELTELEAGYGHVQAQLQECRKKLETRKRGVRYEPK